MNTRIGIVVPSLDFRYSIVWLLLFALSTCLASADLYSSELPISLGDAVVSLNGPWKFHIGDDTRWSAPTFDDETWETVDLTPKAGSHDGDVGLKNYVAGWATRGHQGYSGFAWYRMTMSVHAGDDVFWLVGPANVDNAYEMYFNGHLLGGIGNLETDPPTVVAIQPRLYSIPSEWWEKDGTGLRGVIAVRVAALKGLVAAADGGGIHIAPLLGNEKGARDHYQQEWLQTIAGYMVDAVEPPFFWLLALMALCLLPFEPRERLYPWLAASLVLLGLARFNQPLYFFGQFETVREFVIWRIVVIDALTFGTWTLAWLYAFVSPSRRLVLTCIFLSVCYALSRALSTSLLFPSMSQAEIHSFGLALQGIRLIFLLLLLYAAYFSLRGPTLLKTLGLLSMVIASIGIFASELSLIGVPGIWFPYGVGVSRTQYAYAVFYPVLFSFLLLRLWRFAKPQLAVDARVAADDGG